MASIIERLPAMYMHVRHDGRLIPDGSHDLSDGANCQRFAYAVLAHFGLNLPSWRSSELWADRTLTVPVEVFEPLDLLFFGETAEAYGAHVAVYVGAEAALHLCRAVGHPVVWSLEAFRAQTRYRVLIGGKRVLSQA